MRGLNKVMLIGHLGRDPELRTTPGGASWCTFSVATARSKKVEDRWVEETDWHRVRVYGTQADLCHKYLTKGALVAVEGAVTYDKWETREGQKRTTTEIMANRVTFLNARPSADPVQQSLPASA